MDNNINLLEVNTNNESKCCICQSNLDSEQIYEMPECKHKFHTNCIITWFRYGNIKCPLCNNEGINGPNKLKQYGCWCSYDRYRMIKTFSKKKEAPKILKKEINKINKFEIKEKLISNEINKLKKKRGVFEDMIKTNEKLKNKKRRIESKIHSMKMNIANYPIINLIIPKKKII